MAFSTYRNIKSSFANSFWVANILELFERLAFYGSKAILTVFLAKKVGLEDEAGSLAGLFSGLIFLLPIVTGVLVDKYGFRKTLLTCFAVFSIGYFLIGFAGMEAGQYIVGVIGKRPYLILVLFLTAVGGSLIKPCITGTVHHTTTEKSRSIGFSIYYTLGNLGGAVGPMIALLIRSNLGIEYVLLMSSATCFFLFVGTLIFFREPLEEYEGAVGKTLMMVAKEMVLVFTNIRFISFLIIFSGFWLMFWQIYFLLPFYALEILDFSTFEILESIDAWCIIILTVPATILARKLKPIWAMVIGFLIASLSWLLIGLSGSVISVFIAIALFALGESLQAPRFYEYVGSLAPRGQVGIYMGFAFLPVAIGSFGGGVLADWLRNNFLQSDPAMIWYLIAAIGLISTILMLLYDKVLAPRSTE